MKQIQNKISIFDDCGACQLPDANQCQKAKQIYKDFYAMILLTIRKTFLKWKVPFIDQDIEDIASKTLVTLFDKQCKVLKKYDFSLGLSPAGYLRMKAVNEVTLFIRSNDLFSIKKQKDLMSIDDIATLFVEFDGENAIDLKLKKQILSAAIEKLNSKYQLLIKYFYYDELTTNEICQIMKISVDSFHTRKHRALKKLENNIKKYLTRNNMNDLLKAYILFYLAPKKEEEQWT